MRYTRWLLLILIVVTVITLGIVYRAQKAEQARNEPKPPAALSANTASQSSAWNYTQNDGNRISATISAKNVRQVTGGTRFDLDGVELHLYHKDGKAFDNVKTAKAQFDQADGVLFSDGDVEITLGVPDDAAQKQVGQLLVIRSSGVRYESRTGKSITDRPASFTFARGEGSSTGAEYDPTTHLLMMHKQVNLVWRGSKPGTKPMRVEAGEVTYNELEQKVYLSPWSKLTRGTMTLEAGNATVNLDDGVIRHVEADHAKGNDVDPKRRLDYSADSLHMEFDEDGVIKTITGENNARLLSTSDTALTTVTTNRVDMEFDTSKSESTLQKATATGNSMLESKPVPRPNTQMAETKILKSDVIALSMRPGGQELQEVVTNAPGSLEFVPNHAGDKHRTLNGERLWITYAPKNVIQQFRSVNVTTRTDNETPKGKPAVPPALTWSKDLLAKFDAKGTMDRLEQWGDFRYEEGDRKSVASKAILEYANDLITLEGPAARVWDPTSSTTAERIVMNEKTSEFEAMGNVSSTRLPDQKKGGDSGMLSGDEPIQAKASKMTSSDNNSLIHYEGNALLWQGANRLQGDKIYIDRDESKIEAHGHVTSQLLDKSDDSKEKTPARKTPPKAAVFTIVKAPEMVYTDTDRIAHYTGGVVLTRPGMTVQARELRAYLKEAEKPAEKGTAAAKEPVKAPIPGKEKDTGNNTSLDKAFADGGVVIVQKAADRTRTGTAEHSEYYVAESKVILNQGKPKLVDSFKGTTEGRQLTYFSNNDRLLVDGEKDKPAESNLRRK
jgi:lipopolysaccharide export system protein LptA